jgi:hypothetical protein
MRKADPGSPFFIRRMDKRPERLSDANASISDTPVIDHLSSHQRFGKVRRRFVLMSQPQNFQAIRRRSLTRTRRFCMTVTQRRPAASPWPGHGMIVTLAMKETFND